jgi:hypothetical protein
MMKRKWVTPALKAVGLKDVTRGNGNGNGNGKEPCNPSPNHELQLSDGDAPLRPE